MKFLEKLQGLSETKKKIILWIVVSILFLILLVFYSKIFEKRINNLQKNIKNLPKIEIPKEINSTETTP